jgi:transcriptional regulator with XRE-family HTH domain
MNLSQKEMAERSGVSLGSLKRFESQGKISLESFLKLAHLLGHLKDFEAILLPDENLDDVRMLFSE